MYTTQNEERTISVYKPMKKGLRFRLSSIFSLYNNSQFLTAFSFTIHGLTDVCICFNISIKKP